MAKIGGTDLALLSARLGVYRLGAGRLGFFPWDVKGASNDEPGEYIWDEVKPPTTQWELQPGCEGWVCGFRPVAAFTDLPDPSDEGESVQFTDLSKPVGDIKTWAWDFGDGSTSTSQNPTHTYATAGTYTVTLTVTSDKGTDSATGTHTVEAVVVPPSGGTVIVLVRRNVFGDMQPYTGEDAIVELRTDPGGVLIDTQTTDINGNATFTGVPAQDVSADKTDVGWSTAPDTGTVTEGGTLNLTCDEELV